MCFHAVGKVTCLSLTHNRELCFDFSPDIVFI